MLQPSIANRIDHTLLKPTASTNDVEILCHEAFVYRFRAVCVNSANVALCQRRLPNNIRICSVIGFPLGAMNTEAKLAEAEWAISDGANDLDLVINLGLLTSGSIGNVRRELQRFSELVKKAGIITKLIIETGLLTDCQKILACRLAVDTGFDFVKTCTGFNGGSATVADVRLMRETVGDKAKIKASGGIKDLATARIMIEAGADVIGTSSGVKIILEEEAERMDNQR